MSGAPLLQVSGLRVSAHVDERPRTLVAGVDFEVRQGEAVAIVGESGSGKSLSARAVMGLLPRGLRAGGSVRYEGRELIGLAGGRLRSLRGAEMSMLLQDPFTMLHPMRRAGDQVVETLRLGRDERVPEAVRRLAEVGIHDPSVASRYPFELSGGMRQRVGIAAAIANDPELLIADEPSTALDVTTQHEILRLLRSLQVSRGMGLVLITHDLRVAFSVCDRVYVLYAGRLLEAGSAGELHRQPRHPYTLGLLLSEPPVDRRLAALPAIPGSVPEADAVTGRCAFSARCQWATDACRATAPVLRPVAGGQASACLRLDEIGDELVAARAVLQAEGSAPAARASGVPLVRIDDLRKRFASRRRQGAVQAVGGLSLQAFAGESVGIVGESGSGKTTLGRCIVGLETPTSGSIRIDGIDASDYARCASKDRARLRGTVQMIFQDPYSSLNPALSIGRTLAAALAAGGAARPGETEVAALLSRVGLPAHYADRKPVALSGGERQRVAIARAIAVAPRVIVCDEPVSALDVSVQAQILNLLRRLQGEMGFTYIFITHDLAVVRQICDRTYVMHRGRIVECGRTEDILDRPTDPYTIRLIESVPQATTPTPPAPQAA
jgi:peptide/nickel transport system ATP-binding protein